MLNTVKKRLLFITTTLLLFFTILVISFSLSIFYNNKINRQVNMETQVAYIEEQVSNDYETYHGLVDELAAVASVFYQSKKYDKNILISTVKNNYKNKVPEAGIGIWYDKNVINPTKKWFCVFAYKKDGKVLFNNNLENETYDYVNKYWFTSIREQAQKGNKNIYIPTTCAATGQSSYVLTIGSGIFANGKLVGIITVDWALDNINNWLSNYKPTKNSYILLADKNSDFIIALTGADQNIISSSLKILPWYKDNLKSGDVVKSNHKKYITFPRTLENGLLLIVNVPVDELYGEEYTRLFVISSLMLLAVILLVIIIQSIIAKNINKPIEYLVGMAEKIGGGDLETKITVKEPEEFAKLADAFNKMTFDIKNYITNLNSVTALKNKMESELAIARSIQSSSLPFVFPPYPNRKEFDVYANMVPAKEVGGDFYDFFFINDNEFVFLIADVSGKGVPAALFMMEVKTILRNVIKTGAPLEEAISEVNRTVCKNNKQNYFFTSFIAKINLLNGHITFVNAGHNIPLIKKKDVGYSYLTIENNLVIGAIEDFSYTKLEDILSEDDEILLYTDGVTEAMNFNHELYGEMRLLDVLNSNEYPYLINLVDDIKADIKTFAQGEEQSDDITILAFRYNGPKCDKE